MPDRAIRELLGDRKPTRLEHEFRKRQQAANFANPEWVERLLRGEERAQRDFLSCSWAVGCFEEPS